MGRKISVEKNMPRKIDIDILVFNNLIICSTTLTIPHPKISERLFVLKPWNDIAPDYIIPKIEKTVLQLLEPIKNKTYINRVLIVD